MDLFARSLALTALLAGPVIPATSGTSADTPPQPGMTFDSLKDLPDFSGWWSLAGFPPAPGTQSMKPEVAAAFKKWSAKTEAAATSMRSRTAARTR